MGHGLPDPRFHVLGSLQIEGLAHMPSARQQRLLLCALLATPGRSVARSVLADVVWDGAPPRDAARSLQVLVARLRAALTPLQVGIGSDEGGYALDACAEDVDLVQFRELACPGENDRDRLKAALALWRGYPFGELSAAPYLRTVAGELFVLWEQATGRLHELRLAVGEGRHLIPELARWAQEHPLEESASCRYAAALADTGSTAAALRVLHAFRQTLRETAGLEPSPRMTELERQLLVAPHFGRPSSLPRDGTPTVNIPLLGREREQGEIAELLSARRLVTLVGVGGVGKTRLAVAVAGVVAEGMREGAHWLDLAALPDSGSVAQALCSAMRVEQQGGCSALRSLAMALGSRSLLIVLDNCEHVLTGCRDVAAAVLTSCPNVHLLATSREPLGVTGELVHRLAPLAVVDELGAPGPAVELFRVRARDRGNALSDDEQTARAVVDICRRLDGLPLAVELAAARTTALSPPEIASRLDDLFGLLQLPRAPAGGLPRHRTLLAAIEWSYRLLDVPEQLLFQRLSVFAGRFGLAAVEGISGEPPLTPELILRLLEDLVDRSLVVAEDSALGKRYRLLDTLCHYAADRLWDHGETAQLSERHTAWYVALAKDADRGLRRDGRLVWQERMSDEIDNLRLAFERLIARRDVDGAQRLVASLWAPLVFPGHAPFVQSNWAAEAMALDPEHIGPATSGVRAMAAWAAVVAGDYDRAWNTAESALAAISGGAEDDGSAANVMAVLVTFTRRGRERAAAVAASEIRTAWAQGDPERIIRALLYRYFTRSKAEIGDRLLDATETVDLARRHGQHALLALALWHLAWLKHHLGDPEAEAAARDAARQGLLAQFPLVVAYAATQLSTIAIERRLPLDALRHVAPALAYWRSTGDVRVWTALHQVAEALTDLGRDEAAVKLAGALGDRNVGAHVRLHRDRLAAAGNHLEPAVREKLRRCGSMMSPDEAMDLACAEIAAAVRPGQQREGDRSEAQ